MKKKTTVQPIIDEVTKSPKPKKSVSSPPKPAPKPAELDQDPGGGFNPSHIFPQT
jgi:hypothetical protein